MEPAWPPPWKPRASCWSKKSGPKRTIRFVFYGGEEQGLLGSRGYVASHVDELDKISIVLNHDNGTNYLSGIQSTAAMLEDFEAVLRSDQETGLHSRVRNRPGTRPASGAL